MLTARLEFNLGLRGFRRVALPSVRDALNISPTFPDNLEWGGSNWEYPFNNDIGESADLSKQTTTTLLSHAPVVAEVNKQNNACKAG